MTMQKQKEFSQQSLKIDKRQNIVVANHENVIFFAAQQPSNKIYRHSPEKDEFFMELSIVLERFASNTDTWFERHFEQNQLMNDLVDTVIKYLQDRPETLHHPEKPSLVVFDIDETILTLYYAFQSYFQSLSDKTAIVSRLGVFSSVLDYNQITIIKPIQRLYHFLLANKVSVAFVTGRSDYVPVRIFTERQVRYAGYNSYESIFMFSPAWQGSIASWKDHIRQELSKIFHIVMTLDDDWKNLQGSCLGPYAVWVPSKLDRWAGEEDFFSVLKSKEFSLTFTSDTVTF